MHVMYIYSAPPLATTVDVMSFQLYVSFGDPAASALITCANIYMLATVTWPLPIA